MGYSELSHFVGRSVSMRLIGFACALISSCFNASSQVVSRPVTEMQESEQRDFLIKSLDRGLPQEEIDQVGLLALNRSDMVVPELLKRIEPALSNHSLSDRTITLMAGMIAYAADERAIDGIARLCDVDAKRFQFLVARAFDYATGQKNAYSLAYYALARYSNIEPEVMRWVQNSLEFPSNAHRWARAILQRYGDKPTEVDLRSDPIASRLKGGLPQSVRESLTALLKNRDR